MRFRARIAIPALFAALALAGLAAPVVAQASIAPRVQSPLANTLWTSQIDNVALAIPLLCSVPGESFTVVNNNINIRSAPAGGSVIASIPKGSYFDSNWAVTCGGFAAHYLLGTNLQYGGQQWVKGWRHSNKSQVGYVGVGWLTFRKFCTATGC